MKCLFIVTGRGLGGDAMVALNAMRALEKREFNVKLPLMLLLMVLYLKKMDMNGIKFPFPMQEVILQLNFQPLKGV